MPALDIECMRQAGAILRETLRFVSEEYIREGVSALDVSRKAEEIIRSYEGAAPAFLGYKGFPEAACVSINNQVVHGIPLDRPLLKEGDIISVDCGVRFRDHFSDACRTVGVGEIDSRARKLLKVTKESLEKGIQAARPGNRISDISYAVQKHVERNRFTVSLEFVGHGIGRVIHGPPQIPNYGPPGQGALIEVGNCFAIEPVVFDGSAAAYCAADRWTVLSKQGNLSAHFEDTILITEEGPELLT